MHRDGLKPVTSCVRLCRLQPRIAKWVRRRANSKIVSCEYLLVILAKAKNVPWRTRSLEATRPCKYEGPCLELLRNRLCQMPHSRTAYVAIGSPKIRVAYSQRAV